MKKKPSIKALTRSTNIPEELIRAVIRQIGGWESFRESAIDIASRGIDSGFHGFIYHNDTEPFARNNRRAIAKLAREQAPELGCGIIEMIRGFGCFRGNPPTDEEIGVALFSGQNLDGGINVLNALAWYAAEEVARAYCDTFVID